MRPYRSVINTGPAMKLRPGLHHVLCHSQPPLLQDCPQVGTFLQPHQRALRDSHGVAWCSLNRSASPAAAVQCNHIALLFLSAEDSATQISMAMQVRKAVLLAQGLLQPNKLPWAAITVAGYSQCPVAWTVPHKGQACAPCRLYGGDNPFTILLLPGGQHILFVASPDGCFQGFNS